MANITFEDIQKANALITTTPIKGKEYAGVPQRIKAFRSLYPNGTIETEMLSNDDGVCIFRASVRDESGELLGTGTAFEERGSSFINKTSYIENCETSAVGRALSMCGLGIDVSIASFEEVANAMENQNEEKPKSAEPSKADIIEDADNRAKALAYINKHLDLEKKQKLCACYKVKNVTDMTGAQCKDYLNKLAEKGININE